ncbi:MAG TPA: DUF3078 domain-containing protein [bacterium]|nr:DUF3078 domain-containing protein [bacterium]
MTRIGIALALVATLAAATPWNLAADANLTLNQNAYTNNWGGGATGLLAYALNSNSLAEKQLNSKMNTRSTLKLAFGQTSTQDTSGNWGALVKSTDEIDLESVLRFTLGFVVDPFASAEVQSQFWDKSDATLSRYFNPMDLNEGLGLARQIVKHDKTELVSRLGFGLKQKFDRQALVVDTFGLVADRENRSSNYGGITFATDFTTPLAQEKILYTSKLTLFQALFYSEASMHTGSTADYWKALDVGWENVFAVSVTKVLMVNLDAQLLYDKEIDTKVRLKETLALGLTCKLI